MAQKDRALTLCSLLVLVGGCQPRDVPGDRFVVADSAGVTIARSVSPRLAQPIVVDPTPTMVVSPEFDAPDHLLFNADYAAHLSDRSVVVGNRGTNQLFFFSSGGTFLGAFGGEGEGPGEFQRLFDLYRCDDDRLVVEELSRLSIVQGRSMEFDRNVQIVGHLAVTRADIAGVRSDCSAALMADSDDRSLRVMGGVFDFPVSLYWADFDTGTRDSIGTFGATEAYPWEFRGRPLPVRAPYGRVASWAVHPEGVVLGLAGNASYRVLGSGGQLLRVVRWDAATSPLTDEEWAYYEDAREDALREYPEEAEFQPPAGYLPRPENKPAYADLRVDDIGRVWVHAYGLYGAFGPEPSTQWSVFSSDGEWLAEVHMPIGLKVLAIGEATVIGVLRDAFDVEQIQVHQFGL